VAPPEPQPVRKILIVGGGTAGWITAGVLASRYPRRGEDGISITLIESRQQPPIGVGEGTWPTMRATLKQIGVTETDFLRECDASFKQGSQFVRWADGSDSDAYYHPFTLPVGYEDRNLAPYWLEESAGPKLCREHVLSDGCLQSRPGAEANHHARVHGLGELRLPPGRRQIRALSSPALHRQVGCPSRL